MPIDAIDPESYLEEPLGFFPKTQKKTAGNALTQNVQPSAGGFLPMARAQLGRIEQEINKFDSEPVNYSEMQAYAKKRGEEADYGMLSAMAASLAGERFAPMQAQFLKRAAAAAEPIKVAGGILTPDGQLIRDEDALREAQRKRMEGQRTSVLGQIERFQTAEERRAQSERENRRDNETRQANAQLLAETRRANASAAGAGKPPANYEWGPPGPNGERTLRAISGGPADLKAQAEAQRKADGAVDVDVALSTLRNAYDRLEKGGGITSTKNNALTNASAWASSSGPGQAVGKAFGTDNQSARNDIAMARPALLAALMKATGMSARQMDSNAELKLWLSTATDPTLDVQANRKALADIERKYLRGNATSQSGEAAPAAPRRIRFDAQGNVLP